MFYEVTLKVKPKESTSSTHPTNIYVLADAANRWAAIKKVSTAFEAIPLAQRGDMIITDVSCDVNSTLHGILLDGFIWEDHKIPV